MPNIKVSPPSAASNRAAANDVTGGKKEANSEKLMVRFSLFRIFLIKKENDRFIGKYGRGEG